MGSGEGTTAAGVELMELIANYRPCPVPKWSHDDWD